MANLKEHRNKVFEKMEDNSAAIIFAGTSKVTSEDEYFPFVVNPNFFYLTDITQENSILVLIKSANGNFEYLFVDEYSELKEKWTGKRITYQEARDTSGISSVDANNNFEAMLNMFFAKDNNQYGNINTLYIDQPYEQKIKENVFITDYVKSLESNPLFEGVRILDLRPILTRIRMVKDAQEIEDLKEAIKHTNAGILDLLTFIKPGIYEYSVSDRFEYFEKCNWREGLAFSTIAAGGKNATCLHYPQQKDALRDNTLVLFDLGYTYEGYSADISRTYPVNGKFTPLQRSIYEAVLACNKAVINYVRAGMTINDLQAYATEFLRKECISRGLMSEDGDIRRYYYHNVSHFLGLDTHDTGDRSKPLEDGNVITVEPGLYFAEHGIGVRIEDDVVIREGCGECLSKNIAKEVEDIDLGALLQTQELNEPMREPLKSFELKMNAARSMSQWGAVGKRIAMLRPGLDIRFLRKLPNGSVQMLDEDRAVGERSVRGEV